MLSGSSSSFSFSAELASVPRVAPVKASFRRKGIVSLRGLVGGGWISASGFLWMGD
jgi:hypothetical protein